MIFCDKCGKFLSQKGGDANLTINYSLCPYCTPPKKTSKAQIKASNKYNKAKTVTLCLRLNKETDKDIIEILEQVESKQGYIKDLIRLDILQDNSID